MMEVNISFCNEIGNIVYRLHYRFLSKVNSRQLMKNARIGRERMGNELIKKKLYDLQPFTSKPVGIIGNNIGLILSYL